MKCFGVISYFYQSNFSNKSDISSTVIGIRTRCIQQCDKISTSLAWRLEKYISHHCAQS